MGSIGEAEVQPLSGQVRARIEGLSYGAFCLLLRQLLYRSGYTSVHPVGRLFRPVSGEPDATKQSPIETTMTFDRFDPHRFNPRHGGLDLIALSHTDIATTLTLVQAKQYRGPVPRRFIDELRGAMHRLGADQGLLVTTSHFSDLAMGAAAESHLRPVRLVDGARLCSMLAARGLGVRGGGRDRILDGAYFDALEADSRRQGWPGKGQA